MENCNKFCVFIGNKILLVTKIKDLFVLMNSAMCNCKADNHLPYPQLISKRTILITISRNVFFHFGSYLLEKE